jgi:hypothetical protein
MKGLFGKEEQKIQEKALLSRRRVLCMLFPYRLAWRMMMTALPALQNRSKQPSSSPMNPICSFHPEAQAG